ncbi:MAG TPA: enoyl-CoA hydratase/isomerase family protein, partial [Caulobacteraceae bacterium]|nr:enoyl-CoA hydratase/isomerase family protein [Caulobacteraceae bacterium]
LGALTTGMCAAMIAALQAWRSDNAVELVMIDHAGERGFCAGGDIRMLAESAAGDGRAAREFFHTEYRLNHLIAVYPKPIIAVMDGTVMGGGVGLSLPARYRLATERTRFAMPETGIGLFPDVGAGWWLPRLHGRTGVWVALTGARLGPADCELLGIATDVAPSAGLEELKREVAREPAALERILTEFEADPGPAPIGQHREQIDALFGGDSLEAVVANLVAEGSDWARAQLEVMRPKSPYSAKVTFRLLAQEHPTSLADDLRTEYRLACRVGMGHDFREGVRAVIVEKDNAPVWDPADLAGVTAAMVDAAFAPLPPGEDWTPLPDA